MVAQLDFNNCNLDSFTSVNFTLEWFHVYKNVEKWYPQSVCKKLHENEVEVDERGKIDIRSARLKDRIRKAFGIAYCYKMKQENQLNVLNLRLDETFRTFVDLGNINVTLTTVRRSNFKFLGVRDNCLKSPIRCNDQNINAVFRKMEHWLKGP